MCDRRRVRRLVVLAVVLLPGVGQAARYAVPVPDGVTLLPPPPAAGSPRAEADRRVFEQTRALQGSPRWRMAQDDVDNDPLPRFACAMGQRLTAADAPRLARLLSDVGTGALVGPVKAHYQRPRPYLAGTAPICQPRTADLAANGDYPSGHAANGWLEGLVLAAVMPDRATAILQRARAYGESRVVCGVHTASAVEAGWMAGSAMFAALQANADFAAALAAARAEVAASRQPVDAAQCAAEQAVLAVAPY